MFSNKHQGESGFTLFETLVSFAILSVSIITFYQVGISATNTYATRKHTYNLTEFSRSQLEELVATKTYSDQSGDYQKMWHWSATVRPEENTPPSYLTKTHELIRITIKSWTLDRPDQIVSLYAIQFRKRQ